MTSVSVADNAHDFSRADRRALTGLYWPVPPAEVEPGRLGSAAAEPGDSGHAEVDAVLHGQLAVPLVQHLWARADVTGTGQAERPASGTHESLPR